MRAYENCLLTRKSREDGYWSSIQDFFMHCGGETSPGSLIGIYPMPHSGTVSVTPIRVTLVPLLLAPPPNKRSFQPARSL